MTWNVLRPFSDNHVKHPDVLGCRSLWARPISAWEGWSTGGRCFTQRKWLKPEIAVFVFPVKKRGYFTFLFYLFLRDEADIFNSSSFLLSTGVSYGLAVRKSRARDIISSVPEISKKSPCCDLRVPPQVPSGRGEVKTWPLHTCVCFPSFTCGARGLAPKSPR